MFKRLLLIILVLVLCVACDVPTITPTGTHPTNTAEPTDTAEPTVEPTFTEEPTTTEEPTAAPTATEEVPTATLKPGTGQNRIPNPGCENGIYFFMTITGGGYICEGWYPTSYNIPFTPERNYNKEGLEYGTPEFKITSIPDRVSSGSFAQQLFSTGRVTDSGVYWAVNTTPGENCVLSADVETWTAKEYKDNMTGAVYRSDTKTEDDQEAVKVYLGAYHIGDDLEEIPYAILPFVELDDPLHDQKKFLYEDGIFDIGVWENDPNDISQLIWTHVGFERVSFEFTAGSDIAVVYVLYKTRWPSPFGELYVDNVSLVCDGPDQEPIPFEVPTY